MVDEMDKQKKDSMYCVIYKYNSWNQAMCFIVELLRLRRARETRKECSLVWISLLADLLLLSFSERLEQQQQTKGIEAVCVTNNSS